MAERPISQSHIDAPQPVPRSGAAGINNTLGTTKGASKGTVGVYDRPDHALGSWSPMTIISLILGVLLLLWVLGIFKYLLG